MKDSDDRIEKKYFYGNYRGKVVDNNDPLKAGRCKIRVFSVYDELSDDELPWAVFADPFMGGLEDTGGSFLPSNGAHVWTFFEEGDHRQPVFFAGAPAMNGGTTPDLPSESRESGEYPLNRVFKTKSGHYMEFDSTSGAERIKITHKDGHYLEMKNDNVEVYHKNGHYLDFRPEEVKLNHNNGTFILIDTDGKCTVDAPKTDIGDSGLQPIVLGDNLAEWILNTLKIYLDNHTHTGNLGAPTSPAQTQFGPFQVGTAAQGGEVYSSDNNSK